MSGLLSSALLGLALVAGAPSEGSDKPNYVLDVSKTTKAVKAGEKGTFAVHIKPAEGYKVNQKGPLKLELSAPEHLALEKAKLVREDAKGEETSPEFACGFDAKKKGEEPISVDATFIICDLAGTMCEMKKERLQVAVSVD